MTSSSDEHGMASSLSSESLGALVETTFDVVFEIREDGRIQTVLDSAESPLEYESGHLAGNPITEFVQAKTVHGEANGAETDETPGASNASDFLDSLSGAVDPLLSFEAADGTVVPMAVTVVSNGNGFVCGCRTPRTQEQLLDAIADPLYVLDTADRLQRVNDAMVAYTGYERDTLLGRHIDELVSVGSNDRLPIVRPDDDGSLSATFETPIITSGGDLLLTEANVTALTDASGEYAGVVGVLRDISERKRREKEREMITQILTRVFRHNVRNELMVATGHARMLGQQIDDDLRDHTEQILGTANRLLDHSEKARLLEQVIETDQQYEMDLSRVVDQIVQTAREEHPSAQITTDIPDDCVVEVHPDFAKAIEELVENAIVHAPTEAVPTLDIWLDRQDQIETLFVEDRSGGLAEHEITVLRDGTETALEHSSGVGLWLVRLLVEYSDAEMIAHRTGDGSLMGIRFDQQSIAESPLARAPAHVRDITPQTFDGDTIISRLDARHELEDIYDRVKRTGGHSVLVTGEAGIGKTTLVEQFRESLQSTGEQTTVASGSCESGVERPYDAFREAVDDLPTDQRFSDLLASNAALSVDNPDELQERKQALFADIADELRTVTADGPLVMVIEDIHLADQGTLDLFEYLLSEVGRWGHPVMFLGTYRTSDVDQSHPVLEIAHETAAAGRGTVLELDPFQHSEVETLLADILGIQQPPQSLVEAVHDHTGGIPLFVNELCRHLGETLGPIRSAEALPETLATVTVPDTVERAVSERLADFSDEVWAVLCLGAVAGSEFSFDVLRAASEYRTETLVDCIDTLVQHDLWVRSDDGIAFAHGVVREQALDAIEEDRRQSLHEQIARAIEEVHADTLEAYAGRLASHYEAIGEYETAVAYYLDAAEEASESYATETAIDAYERAIELDQAHDALTDDVFGTVSADLSEMYRTVGDLDAAEDAVETGMAVTPAESESRCRLLGERVTVLRIRGEYDAAREYATQQRELATDLGSRSFEAEAIRSLGTIAWYRGELSQARDQFERSLALFEDIDDQMGQGNCLNNLGIAAWETGEFEQAVEHMERAIEVFEEIGDRRWLAYTLNNLGNVAMDHATFEQAEKYLQRSLDIFDEIDNRHGRGYCLNSLGTLAWYRAAFGDAEAYLQESLGIFEEIGDRRNQADSLDTLGRVFLARGAFEQANECFEESLGLYDDIGDRQAAAEVSVNRARVERKRQRHEAASEFLDRACGILSEVDAGKVQATYERECAALARETGNYDRAVSHLDDAVALCEKHQELWTGVRVRLEEARLALARGRPEEAREATAHPRQSLDERENPLEEAHLSSIDGQIARQEGDTTAARESLAEALAVFREIDAVPDVFTTLDHLVELARAEDDTEQAREWCQEAMDLLSDAPETVVELHRERVEQQADELGVS